MKAFKQMALIAVLSVVTLQVGAQATTSPTFDKVLTSRRSVRNYDATKKISEAEVRTLISAAQNAPSWANQQPTKYYVAISDKKLKAVQDLVGGNKERIKNAPALWASTRLSWECVRRTSSGHCSTFPRTRP